MSNTPPPLKDASLSGVKRPSDTTRKVWWVITAFVAVFSLFFKPMPGAIALVFMGLYFFLIWADDEQKIGACLSMLVYLVLNGFYVTYHSTQLAIDPQLWIANRLLYVVGIALFGKPPVDWGVRKWNSPYAAVGIGMAFIGAAFAVFVQTKLGQTVECTNVVEMACTVKFESWYTPEMLWDDVLMGFALCFLISGTEHATSHARVVRQDSTDS